MAEFNFKCGVMGSGKTNGLIGAYYSYDNIGMKCIIIKPGDDKKAGSNIQSRAGQELIANFIVSKDINLYNLISNYIISNNLDCILVDEAQFLTPKQIDELSYIVDTLNIPVTCFGLIKDAFGNLFPGSKRLIEIVDNFEVYKILCKCRERYATENIRFQKIDGELVPVFEGPQIAIDGIDSEYKSMCRKCANTLKKRYKKMRVD